MLNAIKDFSESKLYSIDLNDNWYRTGVEKTGYFVDNYPELKNKWRLYTGGLALKFMDKIGNEIDFCFIDTTHCNPGEIFDFLMVLPYLKDDATVVFHDVNLHTYSAYERPQHMTNNLLMSSITGQKYLQGNFLKKENEIYFPNIAGIKTIKTTKENIFEVFNLLTLKWVYLPTDTQQKDIISHFEKYYDKYYINYLKEVFKRQKYCFDIEEKQKQERYSVKDFKSIITKLLRPKSTKK
jgi:hypothetical protein